jgi:hypothetical protein
MAEVPEVHRRAGHREQRSQLYLRRIDAVTPVVEGSKTRLHPADMVFMTPATERVVKMLGHAWIVGACASAFLGWLLVPAAFSVDYLTPIVVAGPVVGLVAGGILVCTLRSA